MKYERTNDTRKGLIGGNAQPIVGPLRVGYKVSRGSVLGKRGSLCGFAFDWSALPPSRTRRLTSLTIHCPGLNSRIHVM